MPGVITGEVVVELEIPVVVAPVPEFRRDHAVDHCALIQHRKIEAASVPGDELWRIAVDTVEETADQLRLGVRRFTERPDPKRITLAQRTCDRDHTLQVQGQKSAAGCGAA